MAGEPIPVADTLVFTSEIETAPPAPVPPDVPRETAGEMYATPPPPPTDCAKIAGAKLPPVFILAFVSPTVTLPPLPVPAGITWVSMLVLAAPMFDGSPAIPPPPPTDCAMMP
jgi:hypothetical protein